MYDLLKGMTIVEGASFIAGPSCALHLHQMGADVIRFDALGGGPDFRRWPLSPGGASLYWEGLNKGKRSIAIDLRRPEGRELAVALITAPGEGRGYFVTNYPAEGFLAHHKLAERRPDLITLRVMGWPDGRNGVDYTINAAVGTPLMTGGADLAGDAPANSTPVNSAPVNSVLPAWDLATGAYGAFALLAADRRRRDTGRGAEVRLALSDVAASVMGHLGQVAEALTFGDRPKYGNALFGAFGRDFMTVDGSRIMIVAITERQWTGLVGALGLGADVAALETELGVSFNADEGARFRHRDRLFPLVERAVSGLTLSDLAGRLDKAGACWEPYRSLAAALADDPRLVKSNSLFETVRHPSGLSYPTPGAAAKLPDEPRGHPAPAPRLGEHTDEILAGFLGLPGHEIARLHDLGLVAGPPNK
jgi:2-methylfumaryl-CoA isomerase